MSAAGAVLPRICLDPQTSPAAPNIPDADLLYGGFKINAGFIYRAAPNTEWDFGINVGGDYNPGETGLPCPCFTAPVGFVSRTQPCVCWSTSYVCKRTQQ
jgi:hypothetical protein